MTVGQMYDKIEKFVDSKYPEAIDFSYEVLVKEPDNYYTEIAVYFFDDSSIHVFCNIPEDRRKSIEVEDVMTYKY